MTFPTMLRPLLLACLLPLLAGCGALSALSDATEPLAVFELRPPEGLPVARRVQARDVIIELPTTSGALETDRIMIRPGPLEAQYLPDVRWGEAAPVMVQTLMLRALDATRAFQYVGRRPLGPSGDYAIVTEITEFHADLSPDGESAEVVIGMISRIVREDGVRIIATRSFSAREYAASLEDADLVAAFDAATGRVLSEFTTWTLGALGAG